MNNYNETMGKPHVTPAQWEQRRYEVAREMLKAVYADGNSVLFVNEIVEDAVRFADLLIEELKRGSK